ncbi:helix-turn-helix domain-containing protein [Streptomyces sp. NPDC059786]|uniref:helix-turn-helix domain-containing protein n=1 Tax=Streptomyces sp. NPDC059786 TaxID=3346946 RepID=UPI00365FE93C
MTTNDLDPPTEENRTDRPAADEATLILRLTEIKETLERMAAGPSGAELELMAFTPAKAAELLGKTENWVVEAIQQGRIPHTRIGQSPRMTAEHIRWVRAQGERFPHKYAKPLAA